MRAWVRELLRTDPGVARERRALWEDFAEETAARSIARVRRGVPLPTVEDWDEFKRFEP